MTEVPEDLGIVAVSKEHALWDEIKKAAIKELDNIEYQYFRSKTFQKGILELAEKKLNESNS